MRLARTARIKGEGSVAMVVIVLLLLGGIGWWLYSSRRDAEKTARLFAAEVAQRVAVKYDEKYLHVHLSPEAQRTYLRSARDRLLDRLRELGVPAQPIEVEGDVIFSSYFFDPRASFRANLKYPTKSAQLELDVSRGMTVWQVDTINLPWTPEQAPIPTPTPEVLASSTATPTPTPAAAPQQRSKRKRNR